MLQNHRVHFLESSYARRSEAAINYSLRPWAHILHFSAPPAQVTTTSALESVRRLFEREEQLDRSAFRSNRRV
jgi:hypothetical protein